jgi:hypothetical protein
MIFRKIGVDASSIRKSLPVVVKSSLLAGAGAITASRIVSIAPRIGVIILVGGGWRWSAWSTARRRFRGYPRPVFCVIRQARHPSLVVTPEPRGAAA